MHRTPKTFAGSGTHTHTGEERASRGKEHSPPVVKPTIERLCTADFERHIPIAVCIPFRQKLRAVASN